MRPIQELIADLNERGVKLRAENGRLRVRAPNGAVNAELRAELTDRKEEAITFLRSINGTNTSPALEPGNRPETLPLSFAQQRLWFLQQFDDATAAYNMPAAARLKGKLDKNALQQALTEVVRRHEVLRTIIREENGEPAQYIKPPDAVILRETDYSKLAPDEQSTALRRLMKDEAVRPFDLENDLMLRAALVILDTETYDLALTVHHIATDGWSVGVLLRELATLYTAYAQGRSSPLEELPIQYADYAVWQRRRLQGNEFASQLKYWKKWLSGAPELLSLPLDRPRPPRQSFRGDRRPIQLPAVLSRSLAALSVAEGATLYMTLLSAYYILLSRYSGQTDIVVGSPVAGRNRKEVEPLIGFFVNTLALRIDLSGNPTFRGLLRRVKSMTLEAFDRQDVPFERLVEELQLSRSLSHAPLFQAMFVLQNAAYEPLQLPNLTIEQRNVDFATAKFDITMSIEESNGGLVGWLEYSADIFDRTTIERMIDHWGALLAAIAERPDTRILELSLLSPAERRQLVNAAAGSRNDQRFVPVTRLLEEQTQRTPDNVALKSTASRISYADVNRNANRIARYIHAQHISPGARIGICLPRGSTAFTVILGILKAGCAYVPLDPTYPRKRLQFMISDARPAALMTSDAVETPPLDAATNVINIDRVKDALNAYPDRDLGMSISPDSLAYVIYTSGSTGRPKGVAMRHGALSHLIEWQRKTIHSAASGATLQFASLNFDVSIQEAFAAWSAGGSLIIAPEKLRRDPTALIDFLSEYAIKSMFLPFAALQQLAEAYSGTYSPILGIRRIVTSGEQLYISPAIRAFFQALPDCRLYNQYGPSETHVVTEYALPVAVDTWPTAPPIGVPIDNARVYILDEMLNLTPFGIPGQIYIGGKALADGYLRKSAKTAERFIPDPFADEQGARMYCSGDIGRRLANGSIEFLGRIDNQVKVRGFRVELAELESTLLEHPAVAAAAAVLREDRPGEKLLTAYTVADGSAELSTEELRAFIRARLPEYMLPQRIVALEKLPLTPSGKINRSALPVPEFDRAAIETAYVAPRTPAETALAAIWSTLLRSPQPGVHDNFFSSGGHSLLATQLVSHLRKDQGKIIPVSAIFEMPTIAELATLLEQDGNRTSPTDTAIAPVPAGARIPLSFAQESLWLLEQMEDVGGAYIMAGALRITGKLNRAALEDSLREILRRHTALRTAFVVDGEEVYQEYRPVPDTALVDIEIDASLNALERWDMAQRLIQQETARPFDLQSGALLRAMLMRIDESEYVLLSSMHHIVSDGWTLNLFFRELATLYQAFCKGMPSPLEPLALSFADFAYWQRRFWTDERLAPHIAYWRKQLQGAPALSTFPGDRPRPARQSYRGASLKFTVDEAVCQAIERLGRNTDTTLYMVLLAAFKVLLYRYSGQTDLAIGSPVANRNRREIEPLIGFFVNTLVLRTDLAGNPTFGELLERVKRTALAAYDYQDLPFERLVEIVQPERSLSHSPLFQTMFMEINIPMERTELRDLTLQPIDFPTTSSKFDINVSTIKIDNNLQGYIEYRTDLFDAATIQRLADQFVRLLTYAVENPECHIDKLPLLSNDERRRLVVDWSLSRTTPASATNVVTAIAERAQIRPEAVALEFRDRRLSYGELNERANRLAHYLQGVGIGAGAVVGLCIERSCEMIVGLLGIVKAGAAYVPLDPSYPNDRLEYMLTDSGAAVALTTTLDAAKLPDRSCQLIRLDADWPAIEGASALDPAQDIHREQTVYILYTSGSTGRPKGVVMSHGALRNHMDWMTDAFGFNDSDVFLQKTPLSFDASVWEVFAPLMCGARLIIAEPDGQGDGEYLQKIIAEQNVTTLQLVPAQLRLVLQGIGLRDSAALKRVFCGGEALQPDAVVQMHEQTDAALHNLYGPTESCIDATVWTASRRERHLTIPIGRPIDNVRTYIVDKYLEPTPIGVPGELLIGGAGLAHCYRNRPGLTAEKFIPDPFGTIPGDRLYRTGDLARYNAAGNIEFMGRIDRQIKLRGYRIEPDEIESALLRHPRISGCVAIVQEGSGGSQTLVVYYTSENADPQAESSGEESLTPTALRTSMSGTLPEYMLPSVFVALDSFPTLPNGKIDYKGLPQPDIVAEEYTPPQTPTQQIVSGVWSDVLGRDRVGLHTNFFALGGHSLLATQVISRLRSAFDVALSVRSIFEAPTIAELSQQLDTLRHNAPLPPIKPTEDGNGHSPLSFAQQRLWFLDRLEGPSAAYNMPFALLLRGKLRIEALERAISFTVQRHEALRTNFIELDDAPVQTIRAAEPVNIPLHILKGANDQERHAELMQTAVNDAARPFDLSRDPLIRCTLVKIAADHHALLVNIHHIICDGWSIGVLIQEFMEAYRSECDYNSPQLAPLDIQYADFARWQRTHWESGAFNDQLEYWKHNLAGAPTLLELPWDRPRPVEQTYRGAVISFEVDNETTQALRALSAATGTSLFMTLLSAYAVLIVRLSNQHDIVIGTPIAQRNRREIEPLIGFFVNTLALRIKVDGAASFRTLLEQVRRLALDAYANQDIPFEQLVEELKPERSLSYSPLFQTMFILQNAPREQFTLPDLHVEPLEVESAVAKFDLTVQMLEDGDRLGGSFEYNSDLFDAATIRRMIDAYRLLLRTITATPDERVARLPLLSPNEQRTILRSWNPTTEHYSIAAHIPALFEAQTAATPGAPALCHDTEQWTYSELNIRANRLARHLRSLGVTTGSMVGILLNRSLNLAEGALGILKAGAAYVPLDPAYPGERLDYMMNNARIAALVTQEALLADAPITDAPVICLDTDDASYAELDGSNLNISIAPQSPAYGIYTSGSTGKPKGVIMPHAALLNLIEWQMREPGFQTPARTLQYSSLSFDASFQEMFSAWRCGGSVVMISDAERRNPEVLLGRLQEWDINRLFLPFVALQQLAEIAHVHSLYPSALQHVITAGEQLRSTPEIREFFERMPDCVLDNHYGPSETHVVTSHTLAGPATDWPELPPIGAPIAHTRIYILDALLQPVPQGVIGHLYIGGASLAQGYAYNPAATAAAFVPDPYGDISGARLYRSGDLARYRDNGVIEFIGRADSQIKVRGFRIEPGEIEAALCEHQQVRDAIIHAWEDQPGRKRLAAYVIPHNDFENFSAELEEHLQSKLPDYMKPAAYVLMDAFPRTPSGKADRKALPAPSRAQFTLDAEWVAPHTPLQRQMAELWSAVLGVDSIGLNDNFFNLGGHSLLATQLIARIRRDLDLEIPLKALFEAPTLGALSALLAKQSEADRARRLPPIQPGSAQGPAPLTFAQQRLWFLDKFEEQRSAYNLTVAIRLTGPLDIDALERSLDAVVRRHDVLRSVIQTADGKPVQVTLPHTSGYITLRNSSLHSITPELYDQELRRIAGEETRMAFDIERGPMARAMLAHIDHNDHAFIFTMHHIIGDGWSLEILTRELTAFYAAETRDAPLPLHESKIRYADYAVWQRRELGDIVRRQIDYWKQHLAGAPGLLELPYDRPRPATQTFRGGFVPFAIDAATTEQLRKTGSRQGATIFMTLLAVFKTLLARYSGQSDIIVGTPVAGRTRVEIEPLIGFFVNTLVLRTEITGALSFSELLDRVRDTALAAFAHQDAPFERLVETLEARRSLSHTPLFQVMFALQNAPEIDAEMDELHITPIEFESGSSKFDLTMVVRETGAELQGGIEYNSDLFDRETVKRMAECFQLLAGALSVDPERRVGEAPMVSERMRNQLLIEWNPGSGETPAELFHQSFENIARQYPDTIAAVYEDQTLTYAELNSRANRLARYLRAQGAQTESVVAVCLPPSFDVPVAFLGAMKSGGTYLPLDPDNPKERIGYMLRDSCANIVISASSLRSLFAEGTPLVALDETQASIDILPDDNPEHALHERNSAYVIYTSGSTGAPKGVLIEHRGLRNFAESCRQLFHLQPDDKAIQFSSLNFDLSILEMASVLYVGASIVLAPREKLRAGPPLGDTLREQSITHAFLTPSALSSLPAGELPELKHIVVGGEACTAELVDRWSQGRTMVNAYGPTECTVMATTARCTEGGKPSIGRPILNTQIYILDTYMQPVPRGVIGELYIGGAGLARGYMGRAGLTALQFVPNPFSDISGERLYRTGDMARFLPDGSLDFQGRADDQVKVRGFRIELGEVETALMRYPTVHAAAVALRTDSAGIHDLSAYFVANEPTPTAGELREWLREFLPDYMIPSTFTVMEHLPLTPNDKVDRAALPTGGDSLERSETHTEPRDDTERKLTALWETTLEIREISVHSNFFEIGGNSLKAVALLEAIESWRPGVLKINDVFDFPTIELQARRITAAIANDKSEGTKAKGKSIRRVEF